MPRLRWIEIHPVPEAGGLKARLLEAGYLLHEEDGVETVLIVADRPDPQWLPERCNEVLWWVKDGSPEEVSAVLARHPGWVLRQNAPQEAVLEALEHLLSRDLGSEGWLRQMLHLATLDELLRLVLARILKLSGASQGAIWIRQDSTFYQRCGEGFPEAPIPQERVVGMVRDSQAFLICPSHQVGLIRLKAAQADPRHSMGWLREVEHLLLTAWNLERSQALSFKDDLTVAQNRRCLEVELPRAVRDAAARGESLSLMFLDVDNLKALNSQYGHPTGSKVLTLVAEEALRIIRAQDRLYRYGGDEFCIVVRGTPARGAVKMAERLLTALMNHPLHLDGEAVPVTISIGIADFPEHAEGADRLIERADRALFQAKSEGKARVVIAE